MASDAELPSPASRRQVADHARTVSELADRQALTLESLLGILRSSKLDDRAARALSIDLAASSLVRLRTETDQQRSAILEPVVGAFTRLRNDLRPLVRFRDLEVQFVEPPPTGRALPGEVAHAARAIVRAAVLALVDAGDTRRVRIHWDCDGLNLLIHIRDDGSGELTAHDDALRPIAEKVSSLDGRLEVASTLGWGSNLDIVLPLDPPAALPSLGESVDLSPRERDVLHLLVTGVRNQEIARALGISQNTVKFHVSNLLRKAGARTRAELVALVH
jgi:DNA-binding CsgD family transcriptional regulator